MKRTFRWATGQLFKTKRGNTTRTVGSASLHPPYMYTLCLLMILFSLVAGAEVDARFDGEDISFVADFDGSTQRYIQMTSKGLDLKAEHPLLIALHGHGSDRWQFSGGTTPTGKTARDVAFDRGMILILPDYRAKTSWMGPSAEADLCQIIAIVKKHFSISKVILCGGSMGGSSALSFTAMHPELIDGVASMNGTANHLEYENFQDAIRASYGGSKAEIPLEYKKRSAEYWPERFTMPVAIIASGQDKSVPPHSVLRLGKILEKINPKVLTIYREGMGHTSKPEDVRQALDFVIDAVL